MHFPNHVLFQTSKKDKNWKTHFGLSCSTHIAATAGNIVSRGEAEDVGGNSFAAKKAVGKKTVSQLPRSKIRLTVPCCDLFIYQDNCCNPLAGLQSLLHPFSGNKKTVRLVAQAKHC